MLNMGLEWSLKENLKQKNVFACPSLLKKCPPYYIDYSKYFTIGRITHTENNF